MVRFVLNVGKKEIFMGLFEFNVYCFLNGEYSLNTLRMALF